MVESNSTAAVTDKEEKEWLSDPLVRIVSRRPWQSQPPQFHTLGGGHAQTVVAGINLADNLFTCRFYRFHMGKAKWALWHHMVFQAKTVESKMVQRRRKCRVK